MRVLFAGGGTAGHINPALAAAGYLRSKQPDAEILYVGNKGGMEERLVPAAGFDFKTIRISGFQRKLTAKNIRRNIKTVFRLFSSSIESERIITSAMKGLTESVKIALTELYNNGGEWTHGGETQVLGAAEDCVGLPTTDEAWRFNSFTVEEYEALFEKVANGEVVVSNATEAPEVSIAVDYAA